MFRSSSLISRSIVLISVPLLNILQSSANDIAAVSLQAEYRSLTHWGRVTHICVNKLTIIGSDNGLSPGRRQAIIRTNARILLIGHLGTSFSEILIEICTFSFNKMHLKMSSGKCRPFYLGLNVLTSMRNKKGLDMNSSSDGFSHRRHTIISDKLFTIYKITLKPR